MEENVPDNLKVVTTKDGSKTLLHKGLDEHYHSLHGAYQESMHVFIEMGLKFLGQKEKIQLLEIGFGTGLNAILTFIHRLPESRIYYTGLELFPLNNSTISELKFESFIDEDNFDYFKKIHECTWEYDQQITDHFILKKCKASLLEVKFSDKYDIVYFDAFAPHPQPEMWTPGVFDKLHDTMIPGGVLVTYCSKGDVRRAMQAVGFSVEKLPGPPGKREMLRAIK